jgi:hypothetical protein
MASLNSVAYEDIEVWFVDNGLSHHMTKMRPIFLTFLEIDTNFYVGSGTNTKQTIRGFGYVRFHLESGGFMGIEHMLYVPYLKVSLLSVATFEDEGYAIIFQNGQVLVYSREDTQDTTIVLGVHKERLYRLLRRPIIRSNGFLDSPSYSVSDSMLDSTSAPEALLEIGSCETPSSTKGRTSP